MGTASIVERDRHSACAWPCSHAACAEAIHLFPVLTIELPAPAASSPELALSLHTNRPEGRLFRAVRQCHFTLLTDPDDTLWVEPSGSTAVGRMSTSGAEAISGA